MQFFTKEQLLELLRIASDAAVTAGSLIEQYRDKEIKTSSKQMGSGKASSIVTEVDLLCQEKILATLKPSIIKYDLGLLAEESADDQSRFTKDFFWSVDPLDGTLPFTENVSGYSVSIALVKNDGTPVIGIIYDPRSKSLYSAINGMGAYKDGAKLTPQSTGTFSIYIHRSFLDHPMYKKQIELLNSVALELGHTKTKIVSHAGAAMNACWLVESHPSCYFAIPKSEPGGGNLWDYSASSLIVSEATGRATDYFSKCLDLNRKDSTYMGKSGILMASSKELHTMISILLAQDPLISSLG